MNFYKFIKFWDELFSNKIEDKTVDQVVEECAPNNVLIFKDQFGKETRERIKLPDKFDKFLSDNTGPEILELINMAHQQMTSPLDIIYIHNEPELKWVAEYLRTCTIGERNILVNDVTYFNDTFAMIVCYKDGTEVYVY